MIKRFPLSLLVLAGLGVAAVITIHSVIGPNIGASLTDMGGMQSTSTAMGDDEYVKVAGEALGRVIDEYLKGFAEVEQELARKKLLQTQSLVAEILNKCQEESYGAYRNCTVFSNEFHRLCIEKGLDCRTFDYWCPGSGDSGHSMNLIKYANGDWCIMEPQSGKTSMCGEADPDNSKALQAFVCKQNGRELNDEGTCGCTYAVYDQPQKSNTNPTLCAKAYKSYTDRCVKCCDKERDEGNLMNYTDGQQWMNDCYGACKNGPSL